MCMEERCKVLETDTLRSRAAVNTNIRTSTTSLRPLHTSRPTNLRPPLHTSHHTSRRLTSRRHTSHHTSPHLTSRPRTTSHLTSHPRSVSTVVVAMIDTTRRGVAEWAGLAVYSLIEAVEDVTDRTLVHVFLHFTVQFDVAILYKVFMCTV